MQKRGLILLVVIGVLVVICTFAWTALYLRTQEARLAELRITRMHAVDALRSGIVYATARLNTEDWTAVNNSHIEQGIYNVSIFVTPDGTGGCNASGAAYCIDAEVTY